MVISSESLNHSERVWTDIAVGNAYRKRGRTITPCKSRTSH